METFTITGNKGREKKETDDDDYGFEDKTTEITESKISRIEKLGLFKNLEQQRRSIEERKISLCKGTIAKAISDKVIDSELIEKEEKNR